MSGCMCVKNIGRVSRIRVYVGCQECRVSRMWVCVPFMPPFLLDEVPCIGSKGCS